MTIRCELRQNLTPVLDALVPGGAGTVTDTSPDLDIDLDDAPAEVGRIYAVTGFTPVAAPRGWDRAWEGTNADNGLAVRLVCRGV